MVRVLSAAAAPNEVLLVRRPSGKLVVLKRVRAELQDREDLMLRQDQERRLLRDLGGRCGLVALDDAAATEPRALLLQYLDGGSLRDRLYAFGQERSIPLDAIGRIGSDVIGALSHLHAHDVVHRDINPTNVMFDVNGRAWLIDLSVAAVGRPARGLPAGWEEERVGTIPYTAPEAVLHPAEPAHPSLDVYGLGVVLWEMVTGTQPFERSFDETAEEFAHRLMVAQPPRSASLERRAGPAFAALVSAMLEPSAASRPESMAGVEAAFRSAL